MMKIRIYQFLLLASLLSILNACQWIESIRKPFYAFTDIKIPDGTPTFQKGFKDGCSSVSYARGNVFYRSKYGYNYDPALIGNTEYRFGHARGYNWCFWHIIRVNTGPQTSWDKALFPHDYDKTFDRADYNDVGFFRKGTGTNGGPVGGNINDVLKNFTTTDDGQTLFNNRELLWASGSCNQIFGQDCAY